MFRFYHLPRRCGTTSAQNGFDWRFAAVMTLTALMKVRGDLVCHKRTNQFPLSIRYRLAETAGGRAVSVLLDVSHASFVCTYHPYPRLGPVLSRCGIPPVARAS